MTEQGWMLKGVYMECCRANGHCPLVFGRDMVDGPCTNLATYKVTDGQVQGVDMKGVVFTTHSGGIGPKSEDLLPGKKGIAESAVYISDSTTDKQKKILESFVSTHLNAGRSRTVLGAKFVKIEIEEENGSYHITNPYCEQHLKLTVGGDGKNPIRLENPRQSWNPRLSNVMLCHGQWKYKDYGKTLDFHQTSGVVADFVFSGTV